MDQPNIEFTDKAHIDADAVIVPVPTDATGDAEHGHLDGLLGGLLGRVVEGEGLNGGDGQVMTSLAPATAPFRDVIVVATGETSDPVESWRRALAGALAAGRGRGNTTFAVALPGALDATVATAAACEATILSQYRFDSFKTPSDKNGQVETVTLLGVNEAAAAAGRRAVAVAECTCWSRDLINRSPSDKRPPELADMAASMAKDSGLECEVIDEVRAAELGMNALLAVGRGSSAPPRVVLLHHRGGASTDAPIVLVGKGVTFDTGGISIKPSLNMHHMKADMSGAAAVLGTMRAVAALALPLNVSAVVPMAENMPSDDAYRPGDLVRAYNGVTIEVLNTDAEGRMILADALAYAVATLEPRCIVDLATLTGACVVALGEDVAGVMDSDADLAAELIAAGERVNEPLWRLPMFDVYDKLIESPVADIKNTGGRWGGAITAAKFLARFAGDGPWAHLDIAGPAFRTKGTPYVPEGGAGFGVRLLCSWLQTRTAP